MNKITQNLIALSLALSSTAALSDPAFNTDPTTERLINLYLETESFEIKDRSINDRTVNQFINILDLNFADEIAGSQEKWQLGKKRCTKPNKNGRRFCVQRIKFLHWKFGWEMTKDNNTLTTQSTNAGKL